MNTPAYLRYANQGATRNQPLDPRLVGALGFLGEMGITGEVFSGGQPGKGSGGKRVGSVRHDHGGAGDFRFYKDGRQISWANDADRPLFEEIVRRGKAAGITGFGAGDGYMGLGTMHVGFGSPGVWGAGGRGANAPDWLRKAYGAPAGAPTRENASALQSAMADRENVASSTNESTGMAAPKPTVNIGLKPERSTKLYDAMLERAMSQGANARNPWDLVGGLAQVWAASSEKKEAEAENASELQKALAGAGLDPSYAMAAQLAGGREGAASAIMAQQQDRTQAANRAEQRADRLDEREYQREQDVLANARADQTLALQTAKANAPPDQPSSVREYEYARQNGYTGTYQDWETQNRKAGATVVNTGDASGSGAFYKKADETRATAFNDIANAGLSARRNTQQIDQLERLLGNVQTGGVARLKQVAGQWGINTEGLDDIQAASALINQLVPAQRTPGSGSMSDADLALFKQSIPSIINQPNGNAMIIQTMRGIGAYDAQMGDIANRVLNREIDPAEGQRLMGQVENPLAKLRELVGQQRGDPAPAGPPADMDPALWNIMTPEERALWN